MKKWLSHLESSIPEAARGYSLSAYAIALEGWRRGLKLKFINENYRRKSELYYSLASDIREHRFVVSRGDLTTREAMDICKNKHTAKQYLKKAGVPAPEGENFTKEVADEEIISYARKLGYPLVIKPNDGTGGTGVIANIKNEEDFKQALSYVRYDLGFQNVIVEQYFSGEDLRIYVVGDQAIGAFTRTRANVIGDGKNTIRSLLKMKMKERDKNPALFKRPIKIDQEMHTVLEEQGYTLESIPEKDERVFLKAKGNVSSGGDSVDVTDDISDEIKAVAIKAVKAIPGLENAGIDLIADIDKNTAVVLEINSQASIRNHLFPMVGKARDIPKAIIDYYFPETKNTDYKDKPLYFFEFQDIWEALRDGYAYEYVVPSMPKGDITSTRFIVDGTVRGVGYENWIRIRARKLQLNGYVKQLKNGKLSVVVSGNTENIDKFRKIINNRAPEKAEVTSVEERVRKSPVKMGFEIIKNEQSTADKGSSKKSTSSINVNDTVDGYFPVKIDDVRKPKKKKGNKKSTSKSTTTKKVQKEESKLKRQNEISQTEKGRSKENNRKKRKSILSLLFK